MELKRLVWKRWSWKNNNNTEILQKNACCSKTDTFSSQPSFEEEKKIVDNKAGIPSFEKKKTRNAVIHASESEAAKFTMKSKKGLETLCRLVRKVLISLPQEPNFEVRSIGYFESWQDFQS